MYFSIDYDEQNVNLISKWIDLFKNDILLNKENLQIDYLNTGKELDSVKLHLNGTIDKNMTGLLPMHSKKLHTTIQYIGKKRDTWHSICE